MTALEEWCFEFEISSLEPIPRDTADELLCVETIGWAEDHGLGIGGGYRAVSPETESGATHWRFQFGLCVQTDEGLIPEPQAAELRDRLCRWCTLRGLLFVGGFRAFTLYDIQDTNEPHDSGNAQA